MSVHVLISVHQRHQWQAFAFRIKIKLPGCVGIRAVCYQVYLLYFLRAIRPDTSEPSPSSPSSGSGEPVCGRLAALLAFWSEGLALVAAAFWSALLVAEAALF